MTHRALIADDEPLARRKLRKLIAAVDWLEVVGETGDGPSTVAAVDELEPDLLFLDIRMPGASGLEVLERIEHRPHVIFTTAYDKYAVTAFELQALDYLLKPFGPDRLASALERAREALRSTGPRAAMTERARETLGGRRPLTRLFVKERGKIVPVAVNQIARLEACDDYVAIHVGERRYLVHLRLKEFESTLDSRNFVRVHRSHIVNLEHVKALRPYDGARFQVELRDGTRVIASRSGSKLLREMII